MDGIIYSPHQLNIIEKYFNTLSIKNIKVGTNYFHLSHL